MNLLHFSAVSVSNTLPVSSNAANTSLSSTCALQRKMHFERSSNELMLVKEITKQSIISNNIPLIHVVPCGVPTTGEKVSKMSWSMPHDDTLRHAVLL
jgi:hypothetical protein